MNLTSVTRLAAQLDSPGLRIVDTRAVLADPDAGRAAFRAAHIPGAVFADMNADLSAGKSDPRLGRHPLPGAAQFSALLSRLGITPDTEIVVYDQNDASMAASRFWFLMRLAGHARVSVLDGGMDDWLAAGLPVNALEADLPASVYPVSFGNDFLIAEDALKSILKSGRAALLDARALGRFRGELEPIDKKAGHIPGALSRPYSQNLAGGKFKSAGQLRSEFRSLIRDRNDIVLSCGSGVTACHNALALSIAGIEHWRLYAPGWSGWVADDANPIATGDA